MGCLPDWIQERLPELRDEDTIGYDSDKEMYWRRSKSYCIDFYPTFEEAYNCTNDLHKNIKLDCSLETVLSLKNNNCTAFDSCSGKIFNAKTDAERLYEFEKLWTDFINNIEHFKNNKDDWRTAFKIVNNHPYLWTPLSSEPTFSWIVDEGCTNVTAYLSDEDDRIFFNVFCGEDFIEVSATSIDSAYCKLAEQLVNKLEENESKNPVLNNA